jgi:hypothetical protein
VKIWKDHEGLKTKLYSINTPKKNSQNKVNGNVTCKGTRYEGEKDTQSII